MKSMETPAGNVEIDPYADFVVPVTEGEEQYQEVVDELPQDLSLIHISEPTRPY